MKKSIVFMLSLIVGLVVFAADYTPMTEEATSANATFTAATVTTLTGTTATITTVNANLGGDVTTAAGTGFSGGTGTIIESLLQKSGDVVCASYIIDLTGLASSTTDLDIIGVSTNPAYMASISTNEIATILFGRVTCLEVPAGGADDIDVYEATEATGVFDGGIAALDETALITSGGAWASGTTKGCSPVAGKYIYLTGGEAGTAATYTAGKFLVEVFGY